MDLSTRAQQLEPSVTLAAAAKAKALKAQGVDVLELTVGEPDFLRRLQTFNRLRLLR
jgi:aspartate/methionine/tyrosine aminotransferase